MAQYTYNAYHTGIRIYFSEMPSEFMRSELVSKGWRWNHTMKYWYHYWSIYNETVSGKLFSIDFGN